MNEDIISRAEDVDDMFAILSEQQRRIQTELTMCREDALKEANCSNSIISDDDDNSSTSSCASSVDTNVFSRDIDEDEELGAPKFSPKGKFLHYERREDDIPAIMQTNDIDDEVSCQPKTMASKIRKNRRICVLLISLLVISFAVVTAIAFFSGELFGESSKSKQSKLQLPSASSMITDETKHTHPKYPNHEHPKHTHESDHKHTHHHPQKENEEHTHPLKEHACRNCDDNEEAKHTHTHPKKEHACRGNCTSIDDTSDSDTAVRPFKHGGEEEDVVPWESREAQD